MARSKSPKTSAAKETSSATEQDLKASPQPTQPASVTLANAEPDSRVELASKVDTKKTRGTKAGAPKLEAVRGESRATVVPINLEDEIRKLAYLISERRGFEPGHENEDWLAAEKEVLQRYRQQSA